MDFQENREYSAYAGPIETFDEPCEDEVLTDNNRKNGQIGVEHMKIEKYCSISSEQPTNNHAEAGELARLNESEIYSNKLNFKRHSRKHPKKRRLARNSSEKLLSRPTIPKAYQSDQLVMGPVNEYTCDLCDLTFTRWFRLKDHMVVHQGLRPFQCQKCCRNFSTKDSLKRHLISHTKAKRFACNQCKKSFALFHNLLHHINCVHEKLRPFQCQECGRGYSGGTALKHHMTTHTGVKQFACDLCDKSYTQLHCLKRHKFVIHEQYA